MHQFVYNIIDRLHAVGSKGIPLLKKPTFKKSRVTEKSNFVRYSLQTPDFYEEHSFEKKRGTFSKKPLLSFFESKTQGIKVTVDHGQKTMQLELSPKLNKQLGIDKQELKAIMTEIAENFGIRTDPKTDQSLHDGRHTAYFTTEQYSGQPPEEKKKVAAVIYKKDAKGKLHISILDQSHRDAILEHILGPRSPKPDYKKFPTLI